MGLPVRDGGFSVTAPEEKVWLVVLREAGT